MLLTVSCTTECTSYNMSLLDAAGANVKL